MSKTKSKQHKKIMALLVAIAILSSPCLAVTALASDTTYIKWVDFTVTASVLRDALEIDITTHESNAPISWIDLIAALGQQYGGDFSHYQKKKMLTVQNGR